MEVVTTALLTPLYWCGLPELHRPGLRSLRRYPHWLPHVMVGAPFDALAIRSAIVVPRGPFLSTARLSTDRATLRPKEVASSGAEDAYRACCPWCRGRESNPHMGGCVCQQCPVGEQSTALPFRPSPACCKPVLATRAQCKHCIPLVSFSDLFLSYPCTCAHGEPRRSPWAI